MDDRPGRPADELDGRDGRPDRGSDGGGWGSPVPSEYGSLRGTRSGEQTADGERAARPRRDQTDAADRWGMGSLRRRLQPTGAAPADNRDGAAGAAPAVTGPAVGGAAAPNGSEPSAPGARPAPPSGPDRPAGDASASGEPTMVQAASDEPAASRFAAVPASSGPASSGPASSGPASSGPALSGPAPVGPPAQAQPPALSGGPDGYATAFGSGDQPYGRRRPLRRPVRGRSRATVRHVDVVTVVRVSVIFYLVILVVFVVASLFLWLAADTFGSLPSIEKSVRTLFSLRKFTLHPATVALYTGLAGLVLTVAGTIWNILLAVIYNLIADVVGGVRVELESFTKE